MWRSSRSVIRCIQSMWAAGELWNAAERRMPTFLYHAVHAQDRSSMSMKSNARLCAYCTSTHERCHGHAQDGHWHQASELCQHGAAVRSSQQLCVLPSHGIASLVHSSKLGSGPAMCRVARQSRGEGRVGEPLRCSIAYAAPPAPTVPPVLLVRRAFPLADHGSGIASACPRGPPWGDRGGATPPGT